jgi:hypothetical protein
MEPSVAVDVPASVTFPAKRSVSATIAKQVDRDRSGFQLGVLRDRFSLGGKRVMHGFYYEVGHPLIG